MHVVERVVAVLKRILLVGTCPALRTHECAFASQSEWEAFFRGVGAMRGVAFQASNACGGS